MHCTAFACSRARLRAGIRIDMRTAMMPMTTRSSTRVNPLRLDNMTCLDKQDVLLRRSAGRGSQALTPLLDPQGLDRQTPPEVTSLILTSPGLLTSALIRTIAAILRTLS